MSIIKLLTVMFILFFFVACGGSAGGDANGNGTVPNTIMGMNIKNFSSGDTNGNISIALTSPNITDITITLKDIKLSADKYNITITSITPASITFNKPNEIKNVEIAFSYIGSLGSSNINLNDLKLSYTKVVKSALSNTQMITDERDIILQKPDSIVKSLELIAYAPVKTISQANQSIEILLQVNDLNTSPSKPAIGEKIEIEPISPAEGSIDSFSKTTDTNGRVIFTYTSSAYPKYGTDLNLTIYSNKYPTIKTVVTLDFLAQKDKISNIYLAPSDFIVTAGEETKTIKIVTVNSQNVGVSTHLTIEQLNNKDNVDYGSFNTTSLTTDASGSATLTYTAPDDISALDERNITITEDSTNMQKTLQINFAQASTNPNIIDYEIDAVVENSTALESDGNFVIHIQKIGNPNISIPSSDVKDVNISTHFTQQLTILDTNYHNSAIKTIKYTTSSISGTAIVDIRAKVFNGEKDVLLTASVPITILAGSVASVSLFYVNTQYDSALGVFKDKYTIHAIDKYSNPINTKTQLYPTLINGVKIIANNSGEIHFNGNNTNFVDINASFLDNVSLSDNDRLIILPSSNAYDKSYLGGWTISSVDDNQTLTLAEDYYGIDRSTLHYIIGNQNRFIGNTVVLADIQSNTGSYLTDENGNVQFIVTYDPMLVGHTYSLSAVAYSNNKRSGIALRSSFRGQGYTYTKENVANDGNNHNSAITVAILPAGSGPLANVKIVPTSVSVMPEDQCKIDEALSDFTTNNNGTFRIFVNTAGTNPDVKTCTVSWIPDNASIFYEY